MQQQLSFKITGYLIAPHEWLRIGAYKVIGKGYQYHLGDHSVLPAEELTFRQRLLCLLWPLVIGSVLAFTLAFAWFFSFAWYQYPRRLPDYIWEAHLWHHLLHLTWISLLFYTFLFSFNDVIYAYRLIRQEWGRQQPK